MLQMFVHTHTAANCIAGKPGAFMEQFGGPTRQAAEKAGIKIVANFVDPLAHKVYVVFDVPEGKDLSGLRDVILTWMMWGSAEVATVLSNPEMNS